MISTSYCTCNENNRHEISITDTFVWLTIKKAIKTFTWPKRFEQTIAFEFNDMFSEWYNKETGKAVSDYEMQLIIEVLYMANHPMQPTK